MKRALINRKGLCLLLLCLGQLFGIQSYSQAIEVISGNAKLIGENIRYYEDKFSDMEHEELIPKLGTFINNDRSIFAAPASSSRFWFYFSVNNYSKNKLWIDIGNSNLTEVLFYKFDEDTVLIESFATGCLAEDSTRLTPTYTFQFPIAGSTESETRHFLLGIKTNLVYEIPITLGSYPSISDTRNKYDYPSMFFIGAVLLMLLYNLFVYFVTRDKIYIYYVAYLVTILFIGTYLNNFPIIEKILGKEIAYNYLDTWLWLVFATTGIFTVVYFDLRKTSPRLYKILIAQIAVFVVFGLLNLFIPLARLANPFQVFALIFYLTCLAIGIIMLKRGYQRARLYCIGWSAVIISVVLYVLVYNGYIPYNPFLRNITYYGSFFEILVFSIALGQRINILKVKQETLNAELITKNKELLNLNDSLDSFNYHVSHDLKTVLNNSKSLSKMVEKYNALGQPKKVDEITKKLEGVVTNGIETVESFLSLGQVGNIFQENVEWLAPEDEINLILKRYDLSSSICVRVEKNEIGKMSIHQKAFESIFLNFFTNTIKYNTKKPEANIQFLKSNDDLIFLYKDNGIGIDLIKYGESLFKPFQRANEDSQVEGTGVGLYLVKRIVNGYGGNISIKSESGNGTTFIIKLPQKG